MRGAVYGKAEADGRVRARLVAPADLLPAGGLPRLFWDRHRERRGSEGIHRFSGRSVNGEYT